MTWQDSPSGMPEHCSLTTARAVRSSAMAPDSWQARWLGIDRELSYVEDWQQRRAIVANAELASRGGWGRFVFRLAAIAVALVLVGLPYAYLIMFLRSQGISTLVVQGISLFVGPTIFGIVPLLLYRRDVRRSVREQIRALGTPLCLQCGYNLTGLDSGRCPECGKIAY